MPKVQFIPVKWVEDMAWSFTLGRPVPVLHSYLIETLSAPAVLERRKTPRAEVFPLALRLVGDLYSPRKCGCHVESFFSLRSLIDQVRTRSLAGTLVRSWTALVAFGMAA